MTRGSQASLPSASYGRPARDVSFRGVQVHGEDGTSLGRFRFDVPGCSDQLKQEFAEAFAAATDHGGRWRRKSTCTTASTLIRSLLNYLATLKSPPASIHQVTGEHLASFAMGRRNGSREQVSRILRPLFDGHPGIRVDANEFILRRMPRGAFALEASYSRESLAIIRAAAERTLAKARRRIEVNGRALASATPLTTIPAGIPRYLLEHVANFGDIPRTAGSNIRDQELIKRLGGSHAVVTALFPSYAEIGAAASLLVCLQGWNASVVDDLKPPGAGGATPDGGVGNVPIHTMHLNKPRRGPGNHHMTNSLPDFGEGTSGRLVSQIISMTDQTRATMRALGLPAGKMLLGRREKSSATGGIWIEGFPRHAARDWARQAGLLDENGSPLEISMRRLRRTVVVTGGTALQQTNDTFETVYEAADGRLRSDSVSIMEQGINDALAHAQTQMSMMLGVGPDVDVLASAAKIPREKAAAIIAGKMDTATSACLDIDHSPFSANGPCKVSFLMCLACPLSIATDRHLPRLVLLHDSLSELRSALSEEVWNLDWRGHWERIQDLFERHTTAAERDRARGVCSDIDRQLISDLLDRRLDP